MIVYVAGLPINRVNRRGRLINYCTATPPALTNFGIRAQHKRPQSEEQFSRKYKLKGLGYDFEKVVERVSILFQVEKDYITGRGRQNDRVRARDLLFYWTVVELGMPMVDLARKFDITPAAVSYAVQRGEKMTKERGYQLET